MQRVASHACLNHLAKVGVAGSNPVVRSRKGAPVRASVSWPFRLMTEKRIRRLQVIDGERPVGIVTERDFRGRTRRSSAIPSFRLLAGGEAARVPPMSPPPRIGEAVKPPCDGDDVDGINVADVKP